MSKVQINSIALLLMCAAWFVGMERIPHTGSDRVVVESFSGIPDKMGDWVATKTKVGSNVGLPTSSVLEKYYRNRYGDVAYMTVVYAIGPGDMHQPEICLGGQGWSIKEQEKITVRPTTGAAFPAMMAWMTNELEGQDQMAVYWFKSSVGKTTLLPAHKIEVYLSRLKGRPSTGSALVRLMVGYSGDEYRSKAAAADFAEAVSPYVDQLMAHPPKTRKLKS